MYPCFLLSQEIQTSRVQECKFFSYTDKDKVFGGFAVMTCNTEFYIIVDIDKGKDEVRIKKLAALPGTCKYLASRAHATCTTKEVMIIIVCGLLSISKQ